MFRDAYRHKRVFVTGHTGFKGSWLCEWLLLLGADVSGFSDQVRPAPDLFRALGLAERMTHRIGDVRDAGALRQALHDGQPDYVFHLAAQPLVRAAYRDPSATMAVNVMGTVNLLEAVRAAARPMSVVMVTSDKCYENRESVLPYRETDELGGHDPYSASKAAAELVIASYRRSFFGADSRVAVASARAGNVIGGGDWASDRIVPDCIRSLLANEPIPVRSPRATRPWQHVLEPLSGYLWLGARLAKADAAGDRGLCSAFNFGPRPEASRTVRDLVEEMLRHWPGEWRAAGEPTTLHEAGLLSLNIDKASTQLNWQPTWGFAETVAATAAWYSIVAREGRSAEKTTREQIAAYAAAATRTGMAWACPAPIAPPS